jgi:hypothetical protein
MPVWPRPWPLPKASLPPVASDDIASARAAPTEGPLPDTVCTAGGRLFPRASWTSISPTMEAYRKDSVIRMTVNLGQENQFHSLPGFASRNPGYDRVIPPPLAGEGREGARGPHGLHRWRDTCPLWHRFARRLPRKRGRTAVIARSVATKQSSKWPRLLDCFAYAPNDDIKERSRDASHPSPRGHKTWMAGTSPAMTRN